MVTLFKARVSKFGALISLIAVTAMLALFSLALPEFLISTAGRVFTGVWALTAILIFVAHARRIAGERRRVLPYFAKQRDSGLRKKEQHLERPMRSQ
jgi:hypothetical protein